MRRQIGWALLLLLAAGLVGPGVGAQVPSQTFPETGKTVRGRFLQYWATHGGTAQQGLPISDEMQERSARDGRVYTVQYFERAVYELHPENAPPYDVLLSLLGADYYQQKYGGHAPGGQANPAGGARFFPLTGKHVGCEFLSYWDRYGGLAQFGYPLTEEFTERSDLDGNPYKVQIFERAVFEYHGENPWPNNVLLAQLGTYRYRAAYGEPPTPTAAPAQGCRPTPHGPSFSDHIDEAPVRDSVGTGHVMKGVVRSSRDCAPLPGARLIFWLAGPDGEYDDDHTATVITGGDGAYRFQSNFPAFYGAGGPHIHLYVAAQGHQGLETEYFPSCDETEGTFDIVLAALQH